MLKTLDDKTPKLYTEILLSHVAGQQRVLQVQDLLLGPQLHVGRAARRIDKITQVSIRLHSQRNDDLHTGALVAVWLFV